ncbi:uncharacterized protein LOC109707827 [Ananas comosus]|uniref:Uncharacterized protein LOC109707827 n=1 Tax=Ananas comosus TaxID=4615 RepID=A0A6P5EN84_ANACO|nr:uncharacterized protein LOC109707827 [Ananas comosus]
MCPSTTTNGDYYRLNIRGFFLRLSYADARRPLPETLTLLYSPSIDGRGAPPRARGGARVAVRQHGPALDGGRGAVRGLRGEGQGGGWGLPARRRRAVEAGVALPGGGGGLEEIPEEESDGCDCCGGGGEEKEGGDWEVVVGSGSDGGDEAAVVETVRWAVDVGIWVACLGIGLLVSRAPLWRWKKLILAAKPKF